MTIFGVEAVQHVEHLAGLEDWLADVLQIVGEDFHLGAVVMDGHVTLIQVAELSLVEDDALEFVVVEEVVDGRPRREGIGLALLMNDLQDLMRASGEDPVNNALI
jgi:hypothetical protein